MPKLPWLQWHRERRALTQAELAKEAGVTRVTIARIEKGEDTHPQTARRVADALGVETERLMEPTLKERVEQALAMAGDLKPVTPGSDDFDGYMIEEVRPNHVNVRSGRPLMGRPLMVGFLKGPEGVQPRASAKLHAARAALAEAGFRTELMWGDRGFFVSVTES